MDEKISLSCSYVAKNFLSSFVHSSDLIDGMNS